jgi:hypothetical protein
LLSYVHTSTPPILATKAAASVSAFAAVEALVAGEGYVFLSFSTLMMHPSLMKLFVPQVFIPVVGSSCALSPSTELTAIVDLHNRRIFSACKHV